jgi:hypothetical protein
MEDDRLVVVRSFEQLGCVQGPSARGRSTCAHAQASPPAAEDSVSRAAREVVGAPRERAGETLRFGAPDGRDHDRL